MFSTIKLARWLGPWASPAKTPEVFVLPTEIAGIKTNIYARNESRAFKRRFLIAPGLHYAGPDDPRMDRFCRILAAAGHEVVAPYIPDYLALTPNARAVEDFTRVFDAIGSDEKHGKPIVFSISFGSLLAFALAAQRPDAVDRLVIFGGYADFHETMKFCLAGEVASGRQAVRDPLNQPVVLLNLLDFILPAARSESGPLHHGYEHAQRDALVAAWHRYVRRTWGRPEMKERQRFVAIAEELAPDVPPGVRDLFLIGVGATPGAYELAIPALARFDATALDPSPFLPRVRCPVDLVHGLSDDVIPFEQSQVLASRLAHTAVRVHLTGLYGHTGAQRATLSAIGKELASMVRLLRVLAG
jgi:pimeloyl-ACP methyl ester carboxylesterase